MSRRLVFAAAVLAAAGCGGPSVAPVSGLVTLDGRPLANVEVLFQPEPDKPTSDAGTGSVGRTNSEGRYALTQILPERAGAVTGRHRVSVTTPVGEGAGSGREPIPARYNSRSELTFVVPAGGTDKADFALESKPR